MPSITTTPSHRSPTPLEERQEHIRRAVRPLSRSLSIERSERFPDCLLEIPLAMPWLKQTFRLATRTYSLHNNYLPTPHRLQPIYYSCVCAIFSITSPASSIPPHLHRRLSPCGPGHTIIDRQNLSPRNEEPTHFKKKTTCRLGKPRSTPRWQRWPPSTTPLATSMAPSGNSLDPALPMP